MRKQIRVAGLAVAMLGAGTAWAGVKHSVDVYITPSIRSAGGSLASARSSADNKQYIGVQTGIFAGGEYAYIFAQDSAGTYVGCQSNSPGIVAAARALHGDSFIEFSWDANGACTSLYVYTASQYAPKTP